MRSSRSSTIAGLTLVVALAAVSSSSAHRRDEYLQAARIAIDPDAVHLELDLTPGISVAGDVLAAIDADGNGTLARSEADAYVRQVLRGVTLAVDGRPIETRIAGSSFPPVEAVRQGEGAIRMRMTASLPELAAGAHHLQFANAHRPDIGVYLSNALVPASARVSITDQQRDVDQRTLDVTFFLHPARNRSGARSPLVDLSVVVAAVAVLWFARRVSATATGPDRSSRGARR